MNVSNELNVHALEWTGESVKVLDQRLLPETIKFDQYHDAAAVAEAIRSMRVRGAPAIGIAAAYGFALSVMQHYSELDAEWKSKVLADVQQLAASRPTAVNLFWALDTMQQLLDKQTTNPIEAINKAAIQIHQDDINANQTLGELGADLLGSAASVMTHCNAGALATGFTGETVVRHTRRNNNCACGDQDS